MYVLTDDRSPRFQRLHSAFEKPMTELYLLFYEAALQTFVKFNTFLQREDPLIPIIYEQMVSFLTKLASKFVPVSNIKEATEDLSRLQYKGVENQLPGIYCTNHVGVLMCLLCSATLHSAYSEIFHF